MSELRVVPDRFGNGLSRQSVRRRRLQPRNAVEPRIRRTRREPPGCDQPLARYIGRRERKGSSVQRQSVRRSACRLDRRRFQASASRWDECRPAAAAKRRGPRCRFQPGRSHGRLSCARSPAPNAAARTVSRLRQSLRDRRQSADGSRRADRAGREATPLPGQERIYPALRQSRRRGSPGRSRRRSGRSQ